MYNVCVLCMCSFYSSVAILQGSLSNLMMQLGMVTLKTPLEKLDISYLLT